MRSFFRPLLLLPAIFAACSDSPSSAISPDQGTVSIQLTDGPSLLHEVARVDVYTMRVDLHRKVQDSTKHDTTTTPEWLLVAEPKTAINLLDLQNGTTLSLGSVRAPIGIYNAIRLTIDPRLSSITLKDGTVLRHNTTPGIVYPDTMPLGLIVKLQEPIRVTSDTTTIVLDFDVGRSFLVRQDDLRKHGIKFTAFIHGVTRNKTGGLRGYVRSDSLKGAKVRHAVVQVLKQGTALTDTAQANIIRSTLTTDNGVFEFAFVPPGTYLLRAIPHPELGFLPALSEEFTVKEEKHLDNITIVVRRP